MELQSHTTILVEIVQVILNYFLTGYGGTTTLEVFSPHKEYLLLSRDLLREWWEGTVKPIGNLEVE